MISINITEFGAAAGTNTPQTKYIQDAIDHCFLNGGGEVVIPEGKFLTGGIRLRSNVTLHLMENAVLLGSKNPEDYFGYLDDTVEPLSDDMITNQLWSRVELDEDKDYRFMRIPGSRWNNGLVRAINAHHIAIIGEKNSYIDGQDCYDEMGEQNFRGPHAISMFYCSNVLFKGYCVKGSANWAHSLFFCKNIIADGVSVHDGHDGIHMTSSQNITIENCQFYTSDDCIAGFANTNVFVSDCVLNSACSAMRFGGTNLFVQKCHIYAPCKYEFDGRYNMLSVFTYYSDFSVDIVNTPENIVISDCIIDGADKLLHYNYSGSEMWQTNRPLSSITFRNIQVRDMYMPIIAYGDKKNPITLTISDASFSFKEGYENVDFMHACNFDKITLKNVEIKDGNHVIKKWSDGDIITENVVNSGNDFIVDANEEFKCACI